MRVFVMLILPHVGNKNLFDLMMNSCSLKKRVDSSSEALVGLLYTVDSRYLEFQGTLRNTSRYPYLEISELQKWGKQ